MATGKRQYKITVKLRKKKNGSGSRSLYLDIHKGGKRQKPQFLNIVLEGNERSEENKEKLRIAQAACIAKQNDLVVKKLDLPENTIFKSADTYDYIGEKSANTKGSNGRHLILKLKEFTGKEVLPLAHIDKDFCLGFQQFLTGNLGQGTAFNLIFMLSSYLNRAYEEELIKENPMHRIPKRERLKHKKSQPEYLTLEQIELLSNNSKGIHPQVRLAFFVCVFYRTTLERCECTQAQTDYSYHNGEADGERSFS